MSWTKGGLGMRALMDVPLRTKVLAAILLAILPLALAIGFFGVLIGADNRADRTVGAERETRVAAVHVKATATEAESAVRAFLFVERDPLFRDSFNEAREALPAHLTRLKNLASVTEGGAADHISAAAEVERLALAHLHSLEELLDRPDRATSTDLARSHELLEKLDIATDQLVSDSAQDIEVITSSRARTHARAYWTIVVGGGVGALFSVIAGLVLVRNVVQRVQRNTENARRLAEGGELHPAEPGRDELADLSRRLHETALLMRARESSLRETREEADRANKAKSEFLSRMSHELRTPLNAVIGFAQILKSDLDDARREDVLEILRAGKHLLALIDEVLDLSRIETGMITMSVEPTSVREIVDEAIPLVRGLAKERNIEIGRPEVGADLHVMADHQRFKQVVVNLLSNAVKYNRDGGSVDISITQRNHFVRLQVSDQGSGITPRQQQDLFTPFSRLGAEESSIEGTGLGLALSKHLVEAMNGAMGLESTVGVGSTFWVELPRSTQEVGVAKDSDGEGASTSVQPRTGERIDLAVLQFEDNPSNVRLIQRALRSRDGIELKTATSGREGLALLNEAVFDLILLDVNLPDMSGTDVLRRVRANPPTRDIPVVVLSADATKAQIEQMLTLGAERYLTKPLDMDAFNEVLDDIGTRSKEARSRG